MILLTLKVLFLFVVVASTPRVVSAGAGKCDAPSVTFMWIWAGSIAGFITCQWLL